MGSTAPARTYNGIVSRSTGRSISRPPSTRSLVQKSNQAPRGRYTRRLVAPGGALVLGGMLSTDGAQVEAALRGAGFAPAARVDLDGWASLLLRLVHG